MKLNAELAGENHELNIRREDQRVIATVDGRCYELELRDSPPEYLLLAGSRVYECRVEKMSGRGEVFAVHVGRHDYAIAVMDPKRLHSAQSAGAHEHGAAEIVAPMPGKVVRVLVEAGAAVEAGAGIVVVEAMKMQNEMKAPKAGTVVAVNATVGSTVNAGDVLAVVE
jgi:biotin carboxyl carrier protein